MARIGQFDLARQSRQQRAGLLVGIALLSLMLWQSAWGSLLLYPFTILATWFHEMGHGIAAMLVGAEFERLLIFSDGSGLAQSLRPVDQSRIADAFIAAGGPLGPPLAGAAFILASGTRRAARWALVLLAAALLLSSAIWIRTLVGVAVLVPLGIAVGALAWRGSLVWQRFAVQVLGVQACISTWQQTDYLFSSGGVVGSGLAARSDTQAIADALFLPYWFWAIAISALIAVLLFLSLRRALRD